MIKKSLFVFSFFAVFLLNSYFAHADDGAVTALNSLKEYNGFIEENSLVLVKVFAPWCGHCKAMAEDYIAAAKAMKDVDPRVKFVEVDGTTEGGGEIAKELGVEGYPTLLFVRNKVTSNYSGGRLKDDIITWVKKYTQDPAIRVDDPEKHMKENAITYAVIGTFKNEDSSLYQLAYAYAEVNRDFSFFVLFDKDKKESIRTVRPEDEHDAECDAKDKKGIEECISERSFPLIGPINGDTYMKYMSRQLDIVWFASDPEVYENYKKIWREAARKFEGKFSFVWIDAVQFGRHVTNDLLINDLPGLSIQKRLGRSKRYILPGGLKGVKDAKVIIQFIDDVLDGKVEYSIKSEEIPETNDGVVKTVVAKNLDEMVYRKDKDVILKVYASWCGHCKNIKPVYEQVATMIKEHGYDDRLVVAEIEGDANSSSNDNIAWTSYPTFFYFKKGSDGPPIKMNSSSRGVNDFFEFIKANASFKFDIPKDASKDAKEEKKDGRSEEL